PPPGGVRLLFGALVWHWLDPDTRVPLAARALSPGGTLAIIGHRTAHQDTDLNEQIMAAFREFGPDPGERPPMTEWARPELRAHPDLTDLTTHELVHASTMSTERYLKLMQTFSLFRMRAPEQQRDLLAAVGRAIEAHGGTVGVRGEITLILARKV